MGAAPATLPRRRSRFRGARWGSGCAPREKGREWRLPRWQRQSGRARGEGRGWPAPGPGAMRLARPPCTTWRRQSWGAGTASEGVGALARIARVGDRAGSAARGPAGAGVGARPGPPALRRSRCHPLAPPGAPSVGDSSPGGAKKKKKKSGCCAPWGSGRKRRGHPGSWARPTQAPRTHGGTIFQPTRARAVPSQTFHKAPVDTESGPRPHSLNFKRPVVATGRPRQGQALPSLAGGVPSTEGRAVRARGAFVLTPSPLLPSSPVSRAWSN